MNSSSSNEYEWKMKSIKITEKPEIYGNDFETTTDFYNAVTAAASHIKKVLGAERFDAAIVFGSGHRVLADEIENPIVL